MGSNGPIVEHAKVHEILPALLQGVHYQGTKGPLALLTSHLGETPGKTVAILHFGTAVSRLGESPGKTEAILHLHFGTAVSRLGETPGKTAVAVGPLRRIPA